MGTSATVERANSALAYVKTELRSSMGEERLNDLILLYVHKDINLTYSEIVDRFAIKKPRLMKLRNLLDNAGDETEC